MRRRAPQLLAVVAAVSFLPAVAAGQATLRPAPEPIVTAENERWYLSGEPVTFAGHIYYPTGPLVYFNGNEMVRSGDYQGIPLYSLTTIEPYSKVFVPLAGRLMKPYERRRAGDVAGTAGSRAPSFPIVNPYDERGQVEALTGIAQAPSPPTMLTPLAGTTMPAGEPVPATAAEPAGTSGVAPSPYPLGPLVSAKTPEGLDGIFIEYRQRRWLLSGPAVELDATAFTRIGDYHGFPVYRKGTDEKTIYVTVARNARDLIAPYSAGR